MLNSWKSAFTKGSLAWTDEWTLADQPVFSDLAGLKHFLDLAHIRHTLLKPYFENSDYPLLDLRELLPSFEADLWEHKKLPGFSLVAFARPLNYFNEVFQFDLLHPLHQDLREAQAAEIMGRNLQHFQNRIHKGLHEQFRLQFAKKDISALGSYPEAMPFLTTMDRGQVMSLHNDASGRKRFYLSGVYASFPSDLDTEIKRYGLRIGKFMVKDNELYEKNRLFVYQYLMELYGFPIASERRTSAALFARRLHKMGEKFLVRTLGQSDRTLTTIWNNAENTHYPKVEKIALTTIDPEQEDLIAAVKNGGFFVDEKKRVVIIRVRYLQHKFSQDNVRQERALSVESQELIHPLNGEALQDVNIIRESTSMFLRLNDIVRGEYSGRIFYKRHELVENTETEEKRLKFLYAWLSKHQRRIIGYSDEFFANVLKVLDNYLLSPENYETFAGLNDLYQEVVGKYSYIQQARKVRLLEDLQHRIFKGERINYQRMLVETTALLQNLKFEIVSYFDPLVVNVISIGANILNDRYLLRTYIEKKEEDPSPRRQEIRKNYGKLVGLIDDFKAIRKSRQEALLRHPLITSVKTSGIQS